MDCITNIRQHTLYYVIVLAVCIFPCYAFASIMDNILTYNRPILQFIVGLAYVFGIWFIYASMKELKIYGDSRTMMSNNANIGPILIKLIFGLTLLYLPVTGSVMNYTFFGYGYEHVTAYPINDNSKVSLTKGAYAFIRIFGYVSLIRGIFMLIRCAKQQRQNMSFGKAMVHIVGAVFCINIVGTMDMFKNLTK